MSCGDTGDVNVCLSRVGGFSEHLPSPQSQAPTSLLTFADMVLALDHRSVNDNITDSIKRENLQDHIKREKLQDDHNYASNKSHKMTTRSRSHAMRINKKVQISDSNFRCDKIDDCLSNSDPGGICNCSSLQSSLSIQDGCNSSFCIHKRAKDSLSLPYSSNSCNKHYNQHESDDIKVKRSSSAENITAEPKTNESFREWHPTARKNSPRKSCSFEEVNKNTTGSRTSVENTQKSGSSGQLHRLVNDTLEFPCWPRKADHTYATATWDGTAASHSIFEQELNQIQMDANTEDIRIEKMEITETDALPLKKRNLNERVDEHQAPNVNHAYQQKDDHTYVKQNTNNSTNGFSGYSCSTFPRQKSRDDHTYFSSGGLNKHGASTSGKDWNSVHTIANLSPHTRRREVPEFISTKKDHNYFTSA